jgi:transposase
VLGEGAGCWLGTGASNNARSMSYPIAEVLGRVERRRRFSVEQKVAVLAEATAPGANMSEVARRHGLLPAQVYKWRRLAELGIIGMPGASELPSFVAVEITKDVRSLPVLVPEGKPAAVDGAPRRSRRKKAGLIEIELGCGRRVRVDRDVDAAALQRVLDVLARR